MAICIIILFSNTAADLVRAALLGLGVFWASQQNIQRRDLILLAASLVGLVYLSLGNTWSPYQRLTITDLILERESDNKAVKVGSTLLVQQVFYQVAMDLSPEFLTGLAGNIPMMENAAFSYNLPYQLHSEFRDVLIVGAGMGNDAAAALRNGAKTVDAVDIDPAILEFGVQLHPERPYDNQRVDLIVDDARSYFEKSSKQYDVIAFGLLDSQTLLSGLSNVRLDSFVYTVESLEQARTHLKEDGVVVLTFGAYVSWIDERLGRILEDVFGSGKVNFYKGGIGTTFIAGFSTVHLE